MNGITDGSCLHHLDYLLEFLAAWEKRPVSLTLMAYQWCSAISEAAGRPCPRETPINLPGRLRGLLEIQIRHRPRGPADDPDIPGEMGFSEVGARRSPDVTSHRNPGFPQDLIPRLYVYLLSITLEIGFRNVALTHLLAPLQLDHTSHHKWVFETAFSSGDDEVIADAVCIWTADGGRAPYGSCARHLARRVERDTPFSPRLRRASIRAIERIWVKELKVSRLETVRWLDRLNVDADDTIEKDTWVELLVEVTRSPTGLEDLSSHYWYLLGKLVVASQLDLPLASRNAEAMGSLEKAEDWEKLEVWMAVVWSSLPFSRMPKSESMERIEEVTRKLLLRRPTILREFGDICEAGSLSHPGCRKFKARLQRLCDQARAQQIPSESLPPA